MWRSTGVRGIKGDIMGDGKQATGLFNFHKKNHETPQDLPTDTEGEHDDMDDAIITAGGDGDDAPSRANLSAHSNLSAHANPPVPPTDTEWLKDALQRNTPSGSVDQFEAGTPGITPVATESNAPKHAADTTEADENPGPKLIGEEAERAQAMRTAQDMSLPFVDLNEYQIDKSVVDDIPEELCRRSQLIAISLINDKIVIAMADPSDFTAVDDVSATPGRAVIPMVAMPSQVRNTINRYLRANAELSEISNEIAASAQRSINLETDDDGDDSSPVARFVNLLINQAIDDNCSDIHIEPQEDGLIVRYRIDGVLHIFQRASRAMMQGVISRIKVMADLDIGERRRPQDGRITVRHNGKNIDLRIATLPTVWGETVVMRILSTPAGNLRVEDLNFSPRNLAVYQSAYDRPYGMVLVTGPTGSGKSTTLYATLGDVAVEFRMAGINQVQVNNKAGLTFAAALRSILRADPDVVLIGEIRDQETATIAIEASLTGHLVLSTLHTNDAASAVTRLTEMGVEPFLVSSSLAAVMAQRLARRLCQKCRREDKATRSELAMMGIPWTEGAELPTVYRPVGCSECSNTGYRGRVALQQVMGVNPRIEALIAKGASSQDIEAAAVDDGMTSLRSDGWQKVIAGITSVDEVLRVTV